MYFDVLIPQNRVGTNNDYSTYAKIAWNLRGYFDGFSSIAFHLGAPNLLSTIDSVRVNLELAAVASVPSSIRWVARPHLAMKYTI